MKSRLTYLEYVNKLNLIRHPEGGWYRETYRSARRIQGGDLFPGGRSFGTSIYFLIDTGNFSAFHRILSDETWHFYAGDPLEVIEITSEGLLKSTLVGNNISNGEVFQYTVPAGSWFASRVFAKGTFSLVGCTVAPGFDFCDFEMAAREKLIRDFPDYNGIILELTRD